jgi:hypothetical protein
MSAIISPFFTACDIDAPLRLAQAGWHSTFPEKSEFARFWHDNGGSVVFFAVDETTLRATISAADDLRATVTLIEGVEVAF